MDTFALGLILAERIEQDGRIRQFVAERYASWQGELGQKIIHGQVTLQDLEKLALAKGDVTVESGRQEYLEGIINSLIVG
jgi:xylose isomerase